MPKPALTSSAAQCGTCCHIKSGALSKQGFHRCELSPIWENFALWHNCSRHAMASQSALDKRAVWLKSLAALQPAPALLAAQR